MIYTKTTKFSKRWFREATKEEVASVQLELATETFHARRSGYYVGHYADFESAIAAVRSGPRGWMPLEDEQEL